MSPDGEKPLNAKLLVNTKLVAHDLDEFRRQLYPGLNHVLCKTDVEENAKVDMGNRSVSAHSMRFLRTNCSWRRVNVVLYSKPCVRHLLYTLF